MALRAGTALPGSTGRAFQRAPEKLAKAAFAKKAQDFFCFCLGNQEVKDVSPSITDLFSCQKGKKTPLKWCEEMGQLVLYFNCTEHTRTRRRGSKTFR